MPAILCIMLFRIFHIPSTILTFISYTLKAIVNGSFTIEIILCVAVHD